MPVNQCEFSQSALAVDVELSGGHVGRIERVDHEIPVMTLKKLLGTLDTRMSALLLSANLQPSAVASAYVLAFSGRSGSRGRNQPLQAP